VHISARFCHPEQDCCGQDISLSKSREAGSPHYTFIYMQMFQICRKSGGAAEAAHLGVKGTLGFVDDSKW